MSRSKIVVFIIAVTLAATSVAGFVLYLTGITNVPPPAPNYAEDVAWLCRPDRPDACAAPTTATVFEADGRKRVEAYTPDPDAPIDCFYVYPTVSRVRAGYSPIGTRQEEIEVVRRQLARFASVCRPFAPLYRQVTLAGLVPLLRGKKDISWQVPYRDIAAAWKSYLANDNKGRGFVLIGHSQGSRMLAQLIANEIEGKPIAAQLVSAIIPGINIDLPAGKMVGGTFKHVPLCGTGVQTGCIVAYSSFPADREMSETARFGISKTPGMRDACVDPAGLVGTKYLGAELPLTADLKSKFATDFAALPGLISATCRNEGRFSFLAIDTSQENRTGEPTAAMVDRLGEYNSIHGLHALDINIALGTLVDLVRKETASYRRH